MSLSLGLCPITENTEFDHEYYMKKHMLIVIESIGEHIQNTLVTKGVAGGPGLSAEFYAIATIVFKNQSVLDAALSKVGPARDDIPNFTHTRPVISVGEIIS